MKKILLIVVLVFLTLSVNAQKLTEGSIAPLKGETNMKVVFDFSKITINGMNEQDFIAYRKTKDDPDEDFNLDYAATKKSILQSFIECANDKLIKQQFYLVSDKDTRYTLFIIPVTMREKGDNVCDYEIRDASGSVIAKTSLKGSGGVFGTFENLWNDGYKDAGKNFGKFLAKQLQMQRK